MMCFMLRSFLIFLSLAGCASVSRTQDSNWEQLWSKVRMQGEGKARLEVGAESWVFSYEAILKEQDWLMAIQIPARGEEVLAFPGLNQVQPSIVPDAADFRWRIVQALREASEEKRLAFPQLGQEFVAKMHWLLRWVHATELGLKRDCIAVPQDNAWQCSWDDVRSRWQWWSRKQELVAEIEIRPGWRMRATFRNLTDSVFKRVTYEIIRETSSGESTELRQEFFFR
jgi:hypothetical protein